MILVFICFLFYLLTRNAVIRKTIGMTEVVQPRVSQNILFLTLFIATFFWLLMSFIDYYAFNPGGALVESLIPETGSRDLYLRVFVELLILVAGILSSRLFARLSLQYEAAKERKEILDLALFVANDGIWDWNITENRFFFDTRFYTMSGYEDQEYPASYDEWVKRIHPDDAEQVKDSVQLCLDGGMESFDAEFRYLRKNGTYHWVRSRGKIVRWDEHSKPERFLGTHSDITERKHIQEDARWYHRSFVPLQNSEGDISGVVGIVDDVSEKKQAEIELMQSLEYLQTIYNTLPVLIWSADVNKIVTLTEGRELEYFGRKSGETIGRHLDDLYAANPDVIGYIDSCLSGEQVEYEKEYDGQIYDTILTPLLSASGGSCPIFCRRWTLKLVTFS